MLFPSLKDTKNLEKFQLAVLVVNPETLGFDHVIKLGEIVSKKKAATAVLFDQARTASSRFKIVMTGV